MTDLPRLHNIAIHKTPKLNQHRTGTYTIYRLKTTYDRGERLEQRFKLLQAWGDFIEESSQGALPQFHLKMVA